MLLIVRPYGEWIREHILVILQGAGIATEPARIIEGYEPRALARQIVQADGTSLLIPFHAERTPDGRQIDGVDVLLEARRAGLRSGIPMIMPVSIFATVASEGKLRHQPAEVERWFAEAVCVLNGPFDDHVRHANIVRSWLARVAA